MDQDAIAYEAELLELLPAYLDFLGHFPEKRRSALVTKGQVAVRHGATTVRDVGWALWNGDYVAGLQRLVRDTMRGEARTAELFCRYILRLETAPEAVRAAIKQRRERQRLEAWMATQPPTQAQLDYVAALGYDGPEPANRLEATHLVGELVRQRRLRRNWY